MRKLVTRLTYLWVNSWWEWVQYRSWKTRLSILALVNSLVLQFKPTICNNLRPKFKSAQHTHHGVLSKKSKMRDSIRSMNQIVFQLYISMTVLKSNILLQDTSVFAELNKRVLLLLNCGFGKSQGNNKHIHTRVWPPVITLSLDANLYIL